MFSPRKTDYSDKSAVVLDLDGTIADSEQTIIEIYNQSVIGSNRPKLTHKDYERLRGGTAKDAMAWAGVKIWQLPGLLRLGRREYEKYTREIKVFEGMARVVKKLAASNSDIYVLSSNSKETVKSILAKTGLDANVKILKSSPIFGKHKILKQLLKKHRYNPSECWMIGDEIRDIDAAKKAKMNSIGVAWGLQTEQALQAAGPTVIAKKPEDILKVLKKV